MRTMPQPVIAAVNGAAAGAGMTSRWLRIFALPQKRRRLDKTLRRLACFPIMGNVFPSAVGWASEGAELFYTGDMIDAKTALALGIVNQVVPAAQLEAAVKALAQKSLRPSLPIRAVKKALFASEEKELAQALDKEVREQIRCYLSDDCREGIRAFSKNGHRNFKESSLPGSSPVLIMTNRHETKQLRLERRAPI